MTDCPVDRRPPVAAIESSRVVLRHATDPQGLSVSPKQSVLTYFSTVAYLLRVI